MIKKILILPLIFLSGITYSQINTDTNKIEVYSCMNDALIPYLESEGDKNIQLGRNAVITVFNTSFYNNLYSETICYLKKELKLDKNDVRYMKDQIRNETKSWTWERGRINNATVNDTLGKYQGHHFSKPIISRDNNIFIIVKYSTSQPSGWCGTVSSQYSPMIFKKTENKWSLLKIF